MYMYLHGCIAARLKDELNRLTEARGENEELNKTLRLELSVYDKMAAADNPSSEYRPDVWLTHGMALNCVVISSLCVAKLNFLFRIFFALSVLQLLFFF